MMHRRYGSQYVQNLCLSETLPSKHTDPLAVFRGKVQCRCINARRAFPVFAAVPWETSDTASPFGGSHVTLFIRSRLTRNRRKVWGILGLGRERGRKC